MLRIFRPFLICLALLGALAAPALAQNQYAPVARVNDRVITAYELDQRVRLLTLFRAPGDTRKAALNGLIDERIQLAAAKRAGITVPEADIVAGQEEFAARANLSREEFLQAIAQNGVSPESFRDFVAAGVAWRQVVQERFRGKVSISEAEIDRAIARTDPAAGVRVLLSEIILPANTPQAKAQAESRAAQLSQITSTGAFESAARQYSAAPSRANGGRIDWIELGKLPADLRPLVLALSPGQVTQPVSLPNAIAVFQLRGIDETGAAATEPKTIDYAQFLIPGGRSPAGLSEGARVQARIDTCDDLYGVAKGLPAERLERHKVAPGQVPSDVALELARLDKDESSLGLTRAGGQVLVLTMLCDRTMAAPDAEIDRQAIRNRLVNERVGRLAQNYLAELKSDATIAVN